MSPTSTENMDKWYRGSAWKEWLRQHTGKDNLEEGVDYLLSQRARRDDPQTDEACIDCIKKLIDKGVIQRIPLSNPRQAVERAADLIVELLQKSIPA